MLNDNENDIESYDSGRQKGGRPVESAIASKHETKLRRIKVHNNVSMKYAYGKKHVPCVKRLSRGRLKEIIDNITFNYGLDSSDVCHSTIRRRETRYNSVIVTPMQGGHISSLVKFEDKLVVLIIKMTCIRYSMTPSSCLQLVNDFISGTEV